MSACPASAWWSTLIAWGYVVDRVGERIVLPLGSALTAAATFAAASVDSLVAVAHSCFSAAWRPRAATPPAGGWWSAGFRRAARPRHGDPPDRDTFGSRRGRVGDSPAGRASRCAGSHCSFPRSCARVAAVITAVGVLDPPRPPRAEAHQRRPRQPLPRFLDCCGAFTRSRCCWSPRRPWSGRSPWCG